MKDCLDIFCELSGQQVSYPKSRVFCSNNVRESDARFIVTVCDSPLTKDLGKYLGVPLVHDFLWGHSSSKSVVHLISWDKVYPSKQDGGLGIKNSKDMNQALLAKVGWKLLQNDCGIWSQILKYKYLNKRYITDLNLNKNMVCSSTWKAIAFCAKLIIKGLKWRVGSGATIRFWIDDWVPDVGVLEAHASGSLGVDDLNHCVDSFMVNGEWNVPQLAYVPPWNIVHRIISIHAVARGSTSSTAFNGDLEDWFLENLRDSKVNINFATNWLKANSPISARDEIVRWLEPIEGWVKLNVNGSRNTVSGLIAVGGVLQNHKKNWLKGFVTNKGSGSIMEAELWGLYKGLLMAWNAGYKKVLVKPNSLIVVRLMHIASKQNHPNFSIIQSCKNLMLADWDCSINHIYREGNKLVDGLASMGQSKDNGIVLPVRLFCFLRLISRPFLFETGLCLLLFLISFSLFVLGYALLCTKKRFAGELWYCICTSSSNFVIT
ncbi:hypothetical protein Ddye_002104 [Dipteronia dyeriana]|uniref:RNase H type-1 domain-containing protein n=1 Tax=Dipteronia dyeriana TaxID=168575 RepID=A0AAD9XQH1_9ROSI|nr:hypothetical protein Ddye_002104 [Dipteronia dyeriana]